MKTNKKYPLEKSPLYSLQNKNILADLLNISRKQLLQLANDDCYNVFPKKVKNKNRIIEEPTGSRKYVHLRIQKLARRRQQSVARHSNCLLAEPLVE